MPHVSVSLCLILAGAQAGQSLPSRIATAFAFLASVSWLPTSSHRRAKHFDV